MRYLGIDYGSKRVGIALSDESGEFSIPHSVLKNDKELSETIAHICKENHVTEIIIGESLDYNKKPNPIMKKITAFKIELEEKLKLPVHLEPEFMTSQEAAHIQGHNSLTDASAAALILKSYLDKQK
ncbi:Holliday junction resolvase RuvX [Candidatus Parcubacteria bacterium]|nr:Holliday junction resolvase RuvX [Candidatus Parcubacteria bacterium]